MRLVFLTVTSKLPVWLDSVVEDYQKKISYWVKTEIKVLKPSQFNRDSREKKKSEETQSLIKFLSNDDYVVLCDETGEPFTSKKFAQKFEKILETGKKRIVVIIGGAYGVNDELLKRANLKLLLSPFTLNHHLSLATICEQIYRALTIIKGVNYHND